MNTITLTQRRPLILIMGLLMAIGPLSIDMYLPAFSAIAKNLNTTVSEVTLSLSSFFIGISAGQLLYGPLLERFGRKYPLYAGLSLYFLASLGCALSTSVEMLIVCRFFQALGGSVGMVASRAMVRDLFDVKDNARVFSMLMLVISVSPIIAPTLGGYITSWFGWRAVFLALVVIILLILIGARFYLPETKAPNPAFSLKPIPILRNFVSIFRTPGVPTYLFAGAVSYAGLYAYIGGSPYVFIDIYGVSESAFGWIFALIAAGLIGASQVNNLALKKFESAQIIHAATLIQSLLGLALIVTIWAGWDSLWLTIFLIFAFLCCQGFIFPNATALALAPVGNNAGNASALIGAIQMGAGAAASAIVGWIHNHTAMPMALIMTLCATSAFLIYRIGHGIIQRKLAVA